MADNVWTPIGPPGGMVTGLAFDPSMPFLAYASTAGGFFRSTDGGASWTTSNGGLRDAHLQDLVTVGATVYVGGIDGVYRSDDRGLQFERLANAPVLVSALAAGVGAHPPLFAAGIFAGAWRSDDGGATWQEIDEGLERDQTAPAATINAFLVHPRKAGLVWAGSELGVYRSLDGGSHWTRSSSGLDCLVTSLAIDRGGVLYAGCYVDPAFSVPPPALFASFDLGLHWRPEVRGLAARGVTALLADAAGAVWAGTQDAGVFRTVDGGRHWSPAGTGTGGQAIGALAEAPHRSSLLLAGGGLSLNGATTREGPGIFRTTSSGAAWSLAGPGPDATAIVALAADPVVPGLLTGADPFTGIVRTRSQGVHWRTLDAGLPSSLGLMQLEGDTVQPGELYALGSIGGAPALFHHAPDAATPWRRLRRAPAECGGPLTVGAEGRLYLGGFSGQGGSVCASADGGATWMVGSVGFIQVSSIAAAPSNPLRLYASGFIVPHAPAGPTFYRSDDGGATWTGLGTVSVSEPHGLAVDPQDQDRVLAAGSDGVQRSLDGGTTWQKLSADAASLVRVDPRVPSTVYMATGGAGVVINPQPAVPQVSVSDDGGVTWNPLAHGLPPNLGVLDLAFDAANHSLLYAATAGGGVFILDRAVP